MSDHFGTLWIKGLNKSKKNVIIDQVKSMRSLSYIGEKKKYSSETIDRAFSALNDYQLPSVNLFTNLTSRIKTTGDAGFLKAYFQKCPEQRRNIVLIIGKIYVKPQLTCREGNVFEKATSSPLCHNNFSIHVLLLVWGKKFLFKVLPVYRLDASF